MLTLNQFKKLVLTIQGQRSIYVMGRPGAGKSSIVKEIVDEMGMNYFYDLRLGTEDASTIKGIVIVDPENGTTEETLPYFFPRDPNAFGILILDDFDNAVPAVQAAAYQLILDRKIGKYKLPDNVWVIMASNSRADGGLHFDVKRPIKNRVIIVKAECSHKEFLENANKKCFNQHVQAYIRANPHHLYFESTLDSHLPNYVGAFASPRSWETVSIILDNYEGLDDDHILRESLNGTVGVEVTNSFLEFMTESSFPITAMDVFRGNISKLDERDYSNDKALYTVLDELMTILKDIEKPTYHHKLLVFLSEISNPVIIAKYMKEIISISPKFITPLKKDKNYNEGMELRSVLMDIIEEVANAN